MAFLSGVHSLHRLILKAAMTFFVETLKLCNKLRPKALFGYYGFPGGDFALTPASFAKAMANAERMRPVQGARFSAWILPC
jgi:hypothetical protein